MMEIGLGEQIRCFRKQHSLTQEQLAEVLGVTVGAVHKWEAGRSIPELPLIIEMADFFDTSVDVLLDYKMKDNRLDMTLERLLVYCHSKNRQGLAEAEKALKKYPHSFAVIHRSATLYLIFGIEDGDRRLLRRALELLERSRLLLAQNTDPQINELTLYGQMAEIHLMLDEGERAVDLLQQHNAGGLYNDEIGLILATNLKRFDEALPFLSEALLMNVSSLIRVVMGYLNVYLGRRDNEGAEAILLWGIELISGLQLRQTSVLDKIKAVFYACLAQTRLRTAGREAAKEDLKTALTLAQHFDADPAYAWNRTRFIDANNRASAHDNLGKTAIEGIEKAIAEIEDEELTALWQEVIVDE